MTRETKALLVGGIVVLLAAFGWRAFGSDLRPVVPADLFADTGKRSGPADAPLIGIIFTPRDCGTLIESLRFWNAPFRSGVARVSGVLHGAGADEEKVRKIVRGAGLEFPVRRVSGRSLQRVRHSLGYPAESVVVVLDPRGHVRLAIPLSDLASPEARVRALEFVQSLR